MEITEWWRLVMDSDLEEWTKTLIVNEITQDSLRQTLARIEQQLEDAGESQQAETLRILAQAARTDLKTALMRREDIERQRGGRAETFLMREETGGADSGQTKRVSADRAQPGADVPRGMESGASSVELRGYFAYDSGAPYRIWRFTRDVPQLPALGKWLDDVGGPPHAAAGDELIEDREDGGQVYRLKRADMVIGRPEWWQVGAVVFGGERPAWKGAKQEAEKRELACSNIPPDALFTTSQPLTLKPPHEKADGWKVARPITLDLKTSMDWQRSREEAVEVPAGTMVVDGFREGYAWWAGFSLADGMRYLSHEEFTRILLRNRVAWTPRHRDALRAIGGVQSPSVAYVERPIEALEIRAGDLLVYAHHVEGRPERIAGVCRELSLDDYEILRAAVRNDRGLLASVAGGPGKVRNFVTHARQWGRGLKVWHSRLLHVRPADLSHAVHRPVEAPTDLHAIFELVASCGGQLTPEGMDHA